MPGVYTRLLVRASLQRGFGAIHLATPTPASCTVRYFSSQPANQRIPDFAFTFDIDGVLLRSATPIPHASATLNYLHASRIPFILLTNGGGQPESKRIASLNSKLQLNQPLHPDSFIQSHTPFAEFAVKHGNPSYKDSCVLVLGGEGEKCRQAALNYGFTNVITPGDIFAAYPDIWPFSAPFASYYSSFAQPLPLPIASSANTTNPTLKIDAVFVFNDPRDWALDIQLLLDILLSTNGILGTYSSKNANPSLPNNGFQQDSQPPLYFSNPDLLWAAGYHLNRLGQGGFREAFEGVWRAVTGGAELKYTLLGKPYRLTYEFAERRLVKRRDDIWEKGTPLRKVYMVGDNPESDIRGANEFESGVGAEWISLLTRTGVYDQARGEPKYVPREVVDDVREAVRWGFRDSGWKGDL